MTHLPECGAQFISDPCICKYLRACEQRVSKWALQDAKARESNGITWAQAYSAALDAARKAVAALDVAYDERQNDLPVVGRDDALAAIDALRGK